MSTESARLKALLDETARIVVFSGAGISTESGIPDFRSPGGIWSRLQPIEFGEFLASEDVRRVAWQRKIELDRGLAGALPNRGHRAVAALVASGRCTTVITQNIDGLHTLSGVPEANLVELHGNGTWASCLDCGLRHELEAIKHAFERDGTLPLCTACGGIVKTATISFGQAMPALPMQRALAASEACELFLVLGSSLVVHPAAAFPQIARRNGARLAILNREPTGQDASADLVIHAGIGATLGEALGIA